MPILLTRAHRARQLQPTRLFGVNPEVDCYCRHPKFAQSNARAAGRRPRKFWFIFAVKHNEKAIDNKLFNKLYIRYIQLYLYPTISHHISSYPIISHHIPSYPIISHHIPHHIPPYPTISHYIPTIMKPGYPKKIYARRGAGLSGLSGLSGSGLSRLSGL